MSLKSRLDQLQRKVGKNSRRGETRDFAAEEAKRWEMTERLFERTPEDIREAFVAALMEREEAGYSSKRADRLQSWIRDLGFDRTRLPDDEVHGSPDALQGKAEVSGVGNGSSIGRNRQPAEVRNPRPPGHLQVG